jgi:hypothetical protein
VMICPLIEGNNDLQSHQSSNTRILCMVDGNTKMQSAM